MHLQVPKHSYLHLDPSANSFSQFVWTHVFLVPKSVWTNKMLGPTNILNTRFVGTLNCFEPVFLHQDLFLIQTCLILHFCTQTLAFLMEVLLQDPWVNLSVVMLSPPCSIFLNAAIYQGTHAGMELPRHCHGREVILCSTVRPTKSLCVKHWLVFNGYFSMSKVLQAGPGNGNLAQNGQKLKLWD